MVVRPLHLLLHLLVATLVNAHTIITYPGWRGNNLFANGSVAETDGLSVSGETGSLLYPYGMQWIYPCGGLPVAQNRTRWPITGGSVAVMPGIVSGHRRAMIYINLGIGTNPPNCSFPMAAPFEIAGPSNYGYDGHFCLPQVPLPMGYQPVVGDNATIQVVETALHGAAMYSCVDIVFSDTADVDEVNQTNCYNSTDPGRHIDFGLVSSTLDPNTSCPSNHSSLPDASAPANSSTAQTFSSSAVAGVGAGVGGPLLLAALAGFYMWWRERRRTALLQRELDHRRHNAPIGLPMTQQLSELGGRPISELPAGGVKRVPVRKPGDENSNSN